MPATRPHSILAALPLAGLLCFLVGCGERAPSPPPAAPVSAPVAIRVATVERRAIARPIRVSGLLASKDEQKLSFKVGGVIDRVAVEEGDVVRRGQVLAALKLSEIDAQVAQAEHGLAKAERDLARAEKLEGARVATVEQREDARTGFELARSQLRIARFNREYAVITAPASGRILRRLASAGELVGPGVPLFVLGGTERGWVLRATLTDRERVRVALGDVAQLRFDALDHAPMEARVTELASAPSPMTGTYEVELRVASTDPRLVTGLFGRGELTPRGEEALMLVPPSALLEADGQRGAVYVIGPDRASLRRVELELGPIVGDQLGVRAGLEPGQQVVVAGAAYLTPTSRFEIVDAPAVAEAP
jgi:multidrug efflux system membrane fusion protein